MCRKNSPCAHHHRTLSGYILATKACIDNRKKLVKQQCLLHMSPQYGKLRPTNGLDWFGSLGHPSRFQWVLHLGFVTAARLLNGSQPNFARCLAVSWAGALYIHFRGLLPRNGIFATCKIHCIQVLRSPILAALLRGTRVMCVSQTLQLWAVGATYIWLGGHQVGLWPTF